MALRILLYICLWLTPSFLLAQHTCLSKSEVFQFLSPGGIEPHRCAQHDEDWVKKRQMNTASLNAEGSPPVLTIPVVLHVVTQFGGGLSEARAIQSIEWLNDAFRNINYYDPSEGVDVEIEFCLAKRDPDDMVSNGLTRTTSDLADFVLEGEDRALKELIRWDTREYLNVWVVEEIRSFSLGNGVAGYATFPAFHGAETDGIVIEQQFMGVNESLNSVLAHEAGHYLGLYHTFEGACLNDDCNRDGDLICDTPPDQSTGYVPCDETMNTCQTDVNSGFGQDQDDMIKNYMDYSRLECYNQFTPVQKERMRFFLETTRASLLNSPGCIELCTDNISAEIVLPPSPYIVCDSTPWTTVSVGADNFDWYVNGDFRKSGANVRLWFDQPGLYDVSVDARNADGSCITGDTVRIEVRCDFTIELLTVLEPCYPNAGLLSFEITDIPGSTITWLIGSQEIGNGSRVSFTFPDGAYELTVRVNDGKCTENLTFPVLVGCREICDNGFDDDADGLYDCFDPDCCDECQDHYFQACSPAYEDCLPSQELTIRKKWDSPQDDYLAVFSMVSGDIDGDGEIEIIIWKFNVGFVVLDSNGNEERIIGRPDGERINWICPMAIADIDDDGTAEIFYLNLRNQLVCFEHDGTLRYSTASIISPAGAISWDPIHIVDTDLDGNPEVVLAFNMFDAQTGQFLGAPGPQVPLAFPGGQHVFADMLDDNACADCEGLELIVGNQVVSISDDGSRFDVITNNGLNSAAHACVVDWDLDGDLDVVGSFNSNIVIWDGQTNTILDRVNTGAPRGNANASNLDDDPEPELVVVPLNVDFILGFDNNLSRRWTAPIVGSSGISPVFFDFELDGANEVVLRDQEGLLILDGETGTRRIAIPCQSITNDDRPLIADIDGDGNAELLITCTEDIRIGGFGPVSCFEGDAVKWPKTRPIMPSYNLFHTGFNDDLTIPTYAQRHHLPPSIQDFNSSMTQVALTEEPDTLEFAVILDSFRCTGDGSIVVELTICNSGTIEVNDLDITFYNGSPSNPGTQRITTINIDVTGLNERDCTTERFEIINPLGFPSGELCIVINDPGTKPLPFDFLDGSGFEGPGECDYLNNIVCPLLPNIGTSVNVPDQFVCGNDSTIIILNESYAGYLWNTGATTSTIGVIDTGTYWVEVIGACGGSDRDTFQVKTRQSPMLMLPDSILVCSSQVVNLNAPPGFKSYTWQDGRQESFYTVFNPGIYWVEVVDSCDAIVRDSTIIVFQAEQDLGLPDSINICPGDTVNLSISSFNEISWSPNTDIDCIDCESVNVYPQTTTWYYAFANTTEGCFASDSTLIKVEGELAVRDTVFTCKGDSVLYKNEKYGSGEYSVLVPNQGGCDTLISLLVIDQEADTIREIFPVCFGDSLLYQGEFYTPGNYDITINSIENCDTIIKLTVQERPDIDATIVTTASCPGDSNGTAVVMPMVSGSRLIANWSSGTVVNDTTVTGLKPGSYAVIVVDELNCTRRFEFEIEPTAPVDYDINLTLDSCSSGSGFAIQLEGGVVAELSGPGTDERGANFLNLTEGLYQLSISDSNGCAITDTSILLEPLSQFTYNIQQSVTISPGETTDVPIIGSLDNIRTINWLPENGLVCEDCNFLEAMPLVTTTYTVEIIDENGCLTVLEIIVIVDGQVNVFVPNTFSPNGDNFNDILKLFSNAENVNVIDFEIYSRWGSLVYKEVNTDVQNFIGWDGTFNGQRVNPDVYMYKLSFEIGDQTESRAGSITVLE